MPGVWTCVRIELAGLDQLLDLGDRDAAGGRRHRVEVARGLAVDEVAEAVALPGRDQREVADDALLEHVLLAVEDARLLALRDQRARAGRGEEGGDAGAAGAHALGERPLGDELDLELAGEVLPLELLVLADVRGDHLPDPPVSEQDAEAPVVDAAVVRDDGQVPGALPVERGDEFSGMPQSPKPPTISVAPSKMSLTASSAEATTLSIIGPRS